MAVRRINLTEKLAKMHPNIFESQNDAPRCASFEKARGSGWMQVKSELANGKEPKNVQVISGAQKRTGISSFRYPFYKIFSS